MTRALLLCALPLALQLPTFGIAPRDKMSTYVRQAADNSIARRTKGMNEAQRMTAFVCVDGDRADSILTANECHIYDRQGDIFVASVPLNRLTALAQEKGVRRIEASASCQLTMDTTATVTNTLPVYAGKALPQAYTGKGVVVGVMDVGFDLTHPTFFDATTGKCRVSAFWDQLSKDTIGSNLPVGRDYTTTEEIAAKQHSADGLIETHGTHTMGIAAGNGYDSPYRGMAFESDICAVSNAVNSSVAVIDSTDLYKYTTATDGLGFKYIFDYAERAGLPCVASFSEGYTVGYDTDDSLFCEYLTQLTGPGRIIVASAGNASVSMGYLHKTADRQKAGSFIRSTGNSNAVYVDGDGPFTLHMIAYHDGTTDTLSLHSDSCRTDRIWQQTLTIPSIDTRIRINVARYPSTFVSGDTVYAINIYSAQPLGVDVPVAIALDAEGSDVALRCLAPAWLTNGLADDTWSDAETSHNIHAPACFASVVAVGSTIHRTGFTNYLGRHYDYSQAGRNDGVRSYYSSIGPAAGGTVKPDVMAPGDNIVSAYSSFYIENNPTANDINSDVAHFTYDGRTYAWNSNTGTSMATPVVAGAIALWLQAKPTLTPSDVKDIIAKTARKPENDIDYPNNLYGYGEIDVYRGLLCALGLDGIKGISTRPLQHIGISLLHNGTMTIDCDTPPTEPINVSLYSLGATKVFTTTIAPNGSYHFSIELPSLASGVYAVQLDSHDEACRGSQLLRKE